MFLLCSLYVPFRDFSCDFCPATVVSVTVYLVVLGAPFSSEMSCIFFLLSDFFLLALCRSGFVCLFACSGVQKLRSSMLRTQSCEFFPL